MSDDAGYNEFGFMATLNGQTTQFQTPNLDALASQGVVARQGYTTHPLCSPSRAGLLTGQYPQRYGFETNLATAPSFPFTDTTGFTANEVTIATHLKNQGYTTGMIGKWHNGYIQGTNVPLDKGFDEFFGTWSGARFYFEDTRQANAIRRGNTYYEPQYQAKTKFDGTTCMNCEPNDSATGKRYVTDAFGEEGADFVKRHAGSSNPFFLYMAPTAPHDPYEAKQQDLNLFASIADPFKRTQVAMTYALDRAVGKVLAALDDPNGDGNTSDSVRNNTIVVFLNDNGGTPSNDNKPLRGGKGFTYEGGIRVPMIFSAPGLAPGAYNAPVQSIDILPTVYKAAGGNLGEIDTNGVDLMPYLSNQVSGNPHQSLVWRNETIWAVRKGDWKFACPGGGPWVLYNLATDPGETTDVLAQNPDVWKDLSYDMTAWEATLQKPRWGNSNLYTPYERFVFRAQNFGFANTNSANVWTDAVSQQVTSIRPGDIYANTTLEFPVKNGGNYTVMNNRVRLSGMYFMLSEMKLSGTYSTNTSSSAFLGGLPYLFVKDLNGNGPKLRLDAVASTGWSFLFEVNTELLLLDDLEITGNGTQTFNFSGGIKDYRDPRNVTKTGTSVVNMTGSSTFAGNLAINGGQIRVSGNGALNGANNVTISGAGSLVQSGGLIAVQSINNTAGGTHQFTGGELRVVNYVGNLVNQGGNYSPGASLASSTLSGNLTQASPAAKVTMELGGNASSNNYDSLGISGSAALGGTLQVDLFNGFVQNSGDAFRLITAVGGVNGTFSNTILPVLSGGRSWRLVYGANFLDLIIDPTGGWNGQPGDFNRDGTVDAADYIVWHRNYLSTTNYLADADGNSIVDDADLAIWRSSFGNTGPAAGSSNSIGAVPEPGAVTLAAIAAIAGALSTRRRRLAIEGCEVTADVHDADFVL